jgi:hypothetical protein
MTGENVDMTEEDEGDYKNNSEAWEKKKLCNRLQSCT